jgi:hypothetical protein
MEISISGQAAAFGGAVVLGMAAGLLYALFRILRVRAARRFFSAAGSSVLGFGPTESLFSPMPYSRETDSCGIICFSVLASERFFILYFIQQFHAALRL